MNDMELGDIVHEMLPAESKLSINRCCSTFQERPSFGLILGHIGMRVVEVGNGHDPVVDPHVRHYVEQRNSLKSYFGACVPERSHR